MTTATEISKGDSTKFTPSYNIESPSRLPKSKRSSLQ